MYITPNYCLPQNMGGGRSSIYFTSTCNGLPLPNTARQKQESFTLCKFLLLAVSPTGDYVIDKRIAVAEVQLNGGNFLIDAELLQPLSRTALWLNIRSSYDPIGQGIQPRISGRERKAILQEMLRLKVLAEAIRHARGCGRN